MKAPDPAGLEHVAQALRRAQRVLERKPGRALHDDADANARWDGGVRVVTSHENGSSIASDLNEELGGSGTEVSPGWLFRAGLAACAATSIAMAAAVDGIGLASLEVVASSRSDARGVLGMDDPRCGTVRAGPLSLALEVRIAAPGTAPARVREMVERALGCSPIAQVVRDPMALEVRVLVGED